MPEIATLRSLEYRFIVAQSKFTERVTLVRPGWSCLLCGIGFRLMECVRLRVKDVDPARRRLFVRQGKGGNRRVPVISLGIVEPHSRQIERVRSMHNTTFHCAMVQSIYPTRWIANTPGRRSNSGGSACFPQALGVESRASYTNDAPLLTAANPMKA